MTTSKHTLGGYEVLAVERKDAVGHIVMLHGYGANYQDLVPLAEFMPLKQSYNWWFINAPLTGLFPGMDGRAWFQLDYEVLQRSIQSHDWQGLQNSYGPLVADAAAGLQKFFDAAKLPIEQTILGGFSQGAMLATQCMLTAQKNAKGLLIYSGTLANPSWNQLMTGKTQVPVFQSHGSYDPVLPLEPARLLADEFKNNHFRNFEFVTFGGGHELPAAVLEASSKFIDSLN